MNARRNGRKPDYVVLDLNTQRDFLEAEGRHPVLNHEPLIPALRRVVAWVRRNGVPVVSSLHSLRPEEALPGGRWTFCVEGSVGQQKLPFTLLPSRVEIEYDNTLSLPMEVVRSHQQVVFRTHTSDLLMHPKADRLLTQTEATEFVILGNTLDGAVKAATLGLLTRGKSVAVVLDACGFCDSGAADLAARQIAAKGASLIQVEELVARRTSTRCKYVLDCTVEPGGNGRHPGHSGNGNGKRPPEERVHPVLFVRPRPAPSPARLRPPSAERRTEADA